MKIIILAAGIGKRLGKLAENKPKCLLDFEGKSLLERHLLILEQYLISEILCVTGFRQETIIEEINKIDIEIPIRTVYNPDFESGSILSLWKAREFLLSGDENILMDADVLYDPRIMHRLMHTESPNCFLLDREFEAGDEPVKLCVHNGLLIDFRKQINKDLYFDFQGESVGFFRFSAKMSKKLAEQTQKYINSERTEEPYEEAIRDLLLTEPEAFAFEDISGYPWTEIDFPKDIEHARTILDEIISIEN